MSFVLEGDLAVLRCDAPGCAAVASRARRDAEDDVDLRARLDERAISDGWEVVERGRCASCVAHTLAPAAPVALDAISWRAFPSAEEVAAHNCRTTRGCFGPWLRRTEDALLSVEYLAARFDGTVEIMGAAAHDTGAGLWCPITVDGRRLPRPMAAPDREGAS